MSVKTHSFRGLPNGKATCSLPVPRIANADLAEVLARGSGAIIFSTHEYAALRADVLRLAKRFHRERDMCELHLSTKPIQAPALVYNPFGRGGRFVVQAMLEALAERPGSGADIDLYEQSRALARAIAPVLVWLRDRRSIPLDTRLARLSCEFWWICELLDEGRVTAPVDNESGCFEWNFRGQIPDSVLDPLRRYRDDLGRYDPSSALDREAGPAANEHSHAQLALIASLYHLARLLPRPDRPDVAAIDTYEIVRSGRVLLVHVRAFHLPWVAALWVMRFLIRCVEAIVGEACRIEEGAPAASLGAFPIVLDTKLAAAIADFRTASAVQLWSMP